MRHQGFSTEEIFAALIIANERRCSPPLDEDEVWRIATGIARYEPGALLPPRTLPTRQETPEQSMDYLTDLGNARRLVAQHGHNLRFCPPWKQWFVWNTRRWVHDIDGEVMRRAKATVESIYDEAISLKGDRCKELIDHAKRSRP
jgi:hypothetical protein